MSIMQHLNVEDDDQFWTLVHNQATELKKSRRNAKTITTQDSNDEASESEYTTQKKGKEPMGTSSTNSFAALQDRQADNDDCSVTIESCDSDTEEGHIEPLDMGHHSADERSCPVYNKHSKSNSPQKDGSAEAFIAGNPVQSDGFISEGQMRFGLTDHPVPVSLAH
ncbi:uncharacterized protein A4U43_C01F34990 [Asparagus officinalis]|uniref:Uncharacterized protein n=1 Tax=Asparagus officinalis TaxID=4686 RepID=A0A5P1FXR6_ASPOF|nr:uncharacterized protein A4U43_C01F34990 [Asparagus officinalis]